MTEEPCLLTGIWQALPVELMDGTAKSSRWQARASHRDIVHRGLVYVRHSSQVAEDKRRHRVNRGGLQFQMLLGRGEVSAMALPSRLGYQTALVLTMWKDAGLRWLEVAMPTAACMAKSRVATTIEDVFFFSSGIKFTGNQFGRAPNGYMFVAGQSCGCLDSSLDG